YARRKIAVSNEGGRCDDESSRSREQTFVNAARQFRHRGIAAVGSDNAEGFNHSTDPAPQAKERRKIGQSGEHAEETFQFGYFQLTSFLDNFAQFRSRKIMPDNCGVNHTRHRSRRPGGFIEGFGKIAAPDQIGQAFQELAHVNGRAMQIKEPFRDHGNRDDAANQDGPAQQPRLLYVFDHKSPSYSPFGHEGSVLPASGPLGGSSSLLSASR